MNKEKMKTEAVERMMFLGIDWVSIKKFMDEGKLVESTEGLLSWISDSHFERVLKFEEETNCLVYYVIHNYTSMGEMLTFLYVSDNEEEWEMERDDLKYDRPIAYVANISNELCSEFGYVEIRKNSGIILRIG